MSISSEVTRIKAGITNVKQAIMSKGVTVPTTAKVGDLATYISAITTGIDIKTCTVNITISASVGYIGITATTLTNEKITIFNQSKSSGTFSIPGVVCGSTITIVCNGYFSIDSWPHGRGSVGSSSQYLKAPSTAGTYSVQIIEFDD